MGPQFVVLWQIGCRLTDGRMLGPRGRHAVSVNQIGRSTREVGVTQGLEVSRSAQEVGAALRALEFDC